MTIRDNYGFRTMRPTLFNPEPELFFKGDEKDAPISPPEFDLWRRLQGSLKDVHQNFQDLALLINSMTGLVIAKQRLEIDPDTNLSDSDTQPATPWQNAANDLLTIKSVTPFEFDYSLFWREWRVVIAPGAGQYDTVVIATWEQEYPGLLQDQDAVFAYDATHLQLVTWNDVDNRWEAKTWGTGWTIWLWQAWPAGFELGV